MAVAVVGAGPLGRARSGLYVGGESSQPLLLLRRRSAQQLGGCPNPARRVARAAVVELAEASQSVQAAPDLTWQIWVGAIAGATPFVVAGIEFSKRIAAQQKCAVCGGSGLVKKGGSYFRCGNCGGFLPWYSWKRFFKG